MSDLDKHTQDCKGNRHHLYRYSAKSLYSLTSFVSNLLGSVGVKCWLLRVSIEGAIGESMTIQQQVENLSKLNIGSFFRVNQCRYRVTEVKAFSGTIHYGFISAPTTNQVWTPDCKHGWIPVAFVGQTEVC